MEESQNFGRTERFLVEFYFVNQPQESRTCVSHCANCSVRDESESGIVADRIAGQAIQVEHDCVAALRDHKLVPGGVIHGPRRSDGAGPHFRQEKATVVINPERVAARSEPKNTADAGIGRRGHIRSTPPYPGLNGERLSLKVDGISQYHWRAAALEPEGLANNPSRVTECALNFAVIRPNDIRGARFARPPAHKAVGERPGDVEVDFIGDVGSGVRIEHGLPERAGADVVGVGHHEGGQEAAIFEGLHKEPAAGRRMAGLSPARIEPAAKISG